MRPDNRQPPLTPENTPASLIQANLKDQATGWPGAPPQFGIEPVPQVFTVVGRYGMVARAYSHSDEALQHNWQNAQIMRNEPAIMECIEARMRCTSLLNWHIQPLDRDTRFTNPLNERMRQLILERTKASRWDAEDLAAKVQQILMHTPQFTKLRYALMDGIWYGRQATTHRFGVQNVGGDSRIVMKSWEPRHGDKLVFRYDDGSYDYDPEQVGIRVGPAFEVDQTWIDFHGRKHRRVEPTQFGLTYWFDRIQRRCLAIHKHIVEDADFHEPLKAGSIHGVGIRSRIYWTWWSYQECLRLLLEYVERSALGIEIWRYPMHDKRAEERARDAATNRKSPGRSIILVPVQEGQQADKYGVEIVEPGLGGLNELKSILHELFGHKIKRYVMGQTLTSEADATGMGSGVADAHLATFHDIVRFDAINLEETLTTDLVRWVQLWNFPGSEDIHLRFVIDTESPDAERKLAAYQMAWSMGLAIKSEDVYSVLGSGKPNEGDDVLRNPSFQAQAPGMVGDQMANGMAGQQPPAMAQPGAGGDLMPLAYAANGFASRSRFSTNGRH